MQSFLLSAGKIQHQRKWCWPYILNESIFKQRVYQEDPSTSPAYVTSVLDIWVSIKGSMLVPIIKEIYVGFMQMILSSFLPFSFFFSFFLPLPHPGHMGVPGPRMESELQLQPMLQLQKCQILNPLCWARDQTHTSAETWTAAVRSLTHYTTVGTPGKKLKKSFIEIELGKCCKLYPFSASYNGQLYIKHSNSPESKMII